MARLAYVVVDLGFGDAGKGTTVDYLTKVTGAQLNVRFNGGAQAGHNVVTPDGRHHTFSQFGSGMFHPGVRTYLTPDVCVHPLALLKEGKRLEEIGVSDSFGRLCVDNECFVTTPYHQAYNCLVELSRGDKRHGSCGTGFGETIATKAEKFAIQWKDLGRGSSILMRKLSAAREYYLNLAEQIVIPDSEVAKDWFDVLSDPKTVPAIINLFDQAYARTSRGNHLLINLSDTVIFEGAQGVLLDETHGFAPYYTWSPTTAVNARKYQNLVFEQMSILGVLRLYPTRHGAGPFPTFDEKLTSALVDPYNPHNQWQGSLRVGWHDDLLLTYALSVCEANGVAITDLVVTHLDTWPKVNEWMHAVSYQDSSGTELTRKEIHERLSKPDAAEFLAGVKPVYEASTVKSPYDVLNTLNAISWLNVMMTSAGPTTNDKRTLTELLSAKTLKRRKE